MNKESHFELSGAFNDLLGNIMDNTELFVYNEKEDDETPKQSPQSNQTWPMDKIRRSRFQLLSPMTPKRNYSISQSKSLLLQCFRESKTDPIPRSRRFLASSCSDEGILMDGVLVTSASKAAKKKVSDFASNSLVRSSPHSSIIKNLHKNTEFSPRNKSARNQEVNLSQKSSTGKGKVLTSSPSTKPDTPTQATTIPSKLKATAEPFTFTPRSRQGPVTTLPRSTPLQSFTSPRPLHRPPRLYIPPHASPYMPNLFGTHYLTNLPSPTMHHGFNPSPISISLLPTTPPSTNTSEPLISSPSLDGHELGTMTQAQDLALPSSARFETVKTKKEDWSWSPSDDGLETFTEKQTDFVKEHNRILPDDAFELYKFTKRLSIFTQVCFGDKLPQT